MAGRDIKISLSVNAKDFLVRAASATRMHTRWKEAQMDWTNGVLLEAPESWGGEESAESIALEYVAALEARCDAAGISREKYVEDPE